MLLSDYLTQVRGLVHDSSSIDFSDADMTNYINQARKRVAMDFHTGRTYYPGLTTIAGQETYPITGGTGGVQLTNAGTYASGPVTVSFGAAPAGGLTATGNVVLGGSAPNLFVQQVQMTSWGLGYVAPPTVTFSPGTVTATGTAITMVNVIDLFMMSSLNGLQRTKCLWKPWGEFDTYYRANLLQVGQPIIFTHMREQRLIYVNPIPDQSSYNLEIDAITLPNFLVNSGDTDVQITDPEADCVQFYAAHLALYKLQNFDQAEKMEKKYLRRKLEVANTRYAPRIPNAYLTYLRRIQRGY